MDRNDVLGGVGAIALASGVWGLAGWAWALVTIGLLLLVVYVLLERSTRPHQGGR